VEAGVAGRIKDDDIALVRERATIDVVVGDYLQLRNAGGGELKGLCPFHDEKSPSFHVAPARGLFHCLAGETPVITWDGVRRISELAGGTHRVIGGDGRWIDAPFRSFGVQPLMQVTFTRHLQRKVIHATADHRWFVRSGGSRRSRREVVSRDLKPGDLMVTVLPRSRRVAADVPRQLVGAGSRAADQSPSPKLSDSRLSDALERLGWVVESVEPTDRVEEVYCATVEGSHAFALEDNLLTGNCFGCGEGGDVISFVQKMEHLTFAEAVERLAAKAGVELRYEQGGAAPRMQVGQRTRLVEAHVAAQAFFAEQLHEAGAEPARQFLAERGFDEAAAAQFGVGYSPNNWDTLTKALAAKGFSREELLTAGLVSQGQRGVIDRFRGRLMFPIADITGDVVGFGARKLLESDPQAKYLNTPETPIYKKSHILYGVDRAKRDIARRHQAVVVEGYTDVMACHLAGVTTAVASCGTSFGLDHIQILRRLLMDQDEFRGEVIFTFDGDAAGQKAAMRAFEEDARFVTQTFVAVESAGMDPCELRLAKGDASVRDLVARRVPLFEFYLRTILDRYDLDKPEGRVRALEAAAPVVAGIKVHALRPEYARQLAGWLGMDVDEVMRRVGADQAGRGSRSGAPLPRREQPQRPPDDAALRVERETVKVILQRPALAAAAWGDLAPELFTDRGYRACRDVVDAAGGPKDAEDTPVFLQRVREAAPDDAVRRLLTELAVEPLRSADAAPDRYAAAVLARLQELGVTRRIQDLKGRLQRLNPEQADDYNRLFGDLIALEARKHALREQAIGER
jgi:DNA primase